jgi:tRNA pseudouridine38/39 synthase
MATRIAPEGYEKWSQEQLIARIQLLERQVSLQQGAPSSVLSHSPTVSNAPTWSETPASIPLQPISSPEPQQKPSKATPKPFDASKYDTRLIALKFAYLGQGYNGFEHHRNNTTPLPTVEEELWKALIKTRLINPTPLPETGTEKGNGKEMDKNADLDYGRVGKSEFEKWEREGAEVNWEGCEYSKCGRTDRGVSAFGQVIGIRVRSNRPLPKQKPKNAVSSEVAEEVRDGGVSLAGWEQEGNEKDGEPAKSFNDLTDELPYIQLLNRVLPPDIRIYAWCPNPPADFSARFSCKERRYKYFFTNPCFAPVPGSSSLYTPTTTNDEPKQLREGWLDIPAMRAACDHLIGLHDFRNFCKIDASKQLTNFQRRIFNASIDEVSPLSIPQFLSHTALQNPAATDTQTSQPKMYCFTLHGSAFLWHQVRSIVAILFLVGQGLEKPELVARLLDIEDNSTRPKYEMASDAPLVLWDCIFPAPEEVQSSEEREHGYEDRLDWVYVGDPGGVEPKSRHAPAIGRGKWGRGGVIDDVWEVWRQHKMQETLSGLLLDVVAQQGRCTLDDEVGSGREGEGGLKIPPRVFDGADVGRAKGKYTPVLLRERQEPVEVVNERYARRKGLKAEQRKPEEDDADE